MPVFPDAWLNELKNKTDSVFGFGVHSSKAKGKALLGLLSFSYGKDTILLCIPGQPDVLLLWLSRRRLYGSVCDAD